LEALTMMAIWWLKRQYRNSFFLNLKKLSIRKLFRSLYPNQRHWQFVSIIVDNKVDIHPNGALETKPWGQREFNLPDNQSANFQAEYKSLFTDYLETAAANSGFARLRIWW
jgi:hypothetical protein